MKFIFILLLGIFTFQTSFSSPIKARNYPESPVMIDTNIIIKDPKTGKELNIEGPWFRSKFLLTNESEDPITVRSVGVFVMKDSKVGRFFDFEIPEPFELNPNEWKEFDWKFFDNLRDNNDELLTNAQIHIIGWEGDRANPGNPIKYKHSFKAQ